MALSNTIVVVSSMHAGKLAAHDTRHGDRPFVVGDDEHAPQPSVRFAPSSVVDFLAVLRVAHGNVPAVYIAYGQRQCMGWPYSSMT